MLGNSTNNRPEPMMFDTSWKSGWEVSIGKRGGGVDGIQSGLKNSRLGFGSQKMFLK